MSLQEIIVKGVESIGFIPGWTWLLMLSFGILSLRKEWGSGQLIDLRLFLVILGFIFPIFDSILSFILPDVFYYNSLFGSFLGIALVFALSAIVRYKNVKYILLGYSAYLIHALIFEYISPLFPLNNTRVSLAGVLPFAIEQIRLAINISFAIISFMSILIFSRFINKKSDEVFDYTTPQSAKKYDKKRFEATSGKMITDLEQKITLGLLPDLKINKVGLLMDVGAGTGRMSEFIIKKIKPDRFILFDSSLEMLNIAKEDIERMDHRNISVKYIIGDAESMKFKESPIDLLFSFHLIKHIRNLDNFLSSINKVLKMDGIAIIEMTNRHSLAQLWSGKARLRSISEFNKASKRVGLTVEKYSGCNFLGETILKLSPSFALPLLLAIDSRLTKSMPNYSTKFIIRVKKESRKKNG